MAGIDATLEGASSARQDAAKWLCDRTVGRLQTWMPSGLRRRSLPLC
jgi:hypothetical protein